MLRYLCAGLYTLVANRTRLAKEEEGVLELLALGIIIALPYRLVRRRHRRRQGRIAAAYDRARQVRLSGTGPSRSPSALYGERFYNPR